MAAFPLGLRFGALLLDSQFLYAVPQGWQRHTHYLGGSCLIVPCFIKRFDDGLAFDVFQMVSQCYRICSGKSAISSRKSVTSSFADNVYGSLTARHSGDHFSKVLHGRDSAHLAIRFENGRADVGATQQFQRRSQSRRSGARNDRNL
jgi:hypothetical protein